MCLHSLATVAQNVKGGFPDDGDEVAAVGPEDILHLHVDPADDATLVPVIEAHKVGAPEAEEGAPVDALGAKVRAKAPRLGKVFEHFHLARRFAHRVLVGVRRPRKVERRPEGFVAPGERCVNDEFAVATHNHKAPVRVVLQRLRIQIARPEILRRERQALAVLHLVVRRERLDAHRLNLVVLRPDDLTRRVHRRHRLLATNLEHDGSLVVANRNVIRALDHRSGPHSLEAIVESVLKAVGSGVPDAERAILRTGDDDGELRMEAHGADVVRVALQRLHARLGLVVPNLDELVIRARDEVRSVATHVVIHTVHPLVVPFESKVGNLLSKAPHLDGPVQRGGREGVGVLRVERHLHDVVRVTLENLRAGPLLVPIPQLDEHVVRRREEIRQGRVHRDAANVIRVRLERLDELRGVVVIHADEHVIRAGNHPLLAHHKLGGADRQLGHLKRFDER
mmetsp:Transcript_12328/g.40502  ORF Transcript_12328/g.40502 Transcript_12328/m.40502 type:complete len:453 (+) Transcript_12328:1401-2759(+)